MKLIYIFLLLCFALIIVWRVNLNIISGFASAAFSGGFGRLWHRHYYLRTRHWQEVRKSALRRARYKCSVCHLSGVPLDVHHLSYKNLWHEQPQDLKVACRACHKMLHGY